MLSVTISASWPRWMPCRSSPESRRGRASCGRSSLWQHGEQTRIAAPARTPRSIAWSVAVSQACRAIITSTASGATLRRSPSTKRSPAQPQRSATPLQNATRSARSSTPVTSRRDAEAPAQVLVDGERQVALAAAVVDDADRRRAVAARRAGKASSAWSRTSRNLSICRHLRAIDGTSRWLRVGDAELGQERQVERQAARARAVVRREASTSPARRRRRPAVARVAALVPAQRRLALLADEQLRVAAGRVQRRVRERGRVGRVERGGDLGDAVVDAEIAGHVARRVGRDERQRRLALQRDQADANALAARRRHGAASTARASRTRRRRSPRAAPRGTRRAVPRQRRDGGGGERWRDGHAKRGRGAIVGAAARTTIALPAPPRHAPCSESPTTRRSSSP